MKLDAWPFSTTVRVHPHAAMEQIRAAVRPAILRSQRRWRRKARMRRLARRSETALMVVCGVLGTAIAAVWLANEAYQFVVYLAERAVKASRMRCFLRGQHVPVRHPLGGFTCAECSHVGVSLEEMGYGFESGYVPVLRKHYDRESGLTRTSEWTPTRRGW